MLKINAGNNFSFRDKHELGKLRAETLIKGLEYSGIEVIGVGPIELGLPEPLLREFARNSSVDLVCANLPGMLPYVRLRKDGGRLKVLVTSVIDPGVLQPMGIKTSVSLKEPVAALRKILGSIDHDLAIVVVHASRKRLQEIVSRCPGIDLVIDGLTRGRGGNLNEKNMEKPGFLPIVYNNKRGQFVYYLDLQLENNGRIAWQPPVAIKVAVKKITPDPEIEKLMADYQQKRAKILAEIRRQQREKKLAQFREVQKRAAKINNMYLGDLGCRECHPQAWEAWSKSGHARAIESLKKKQREKDDDCLRCHVTGMGDPTAVGGFSSLQSTPRMAGVQCEACHGPGANHAQNPQSRKMIPGNKVDCRSCHNPENDPGFDYDRRLPKIRH